MTVPTILFAIVLANLIYDLTGFIIKCFDGTKREKNIEKKDCEKLDKHEDYI